MIRQLKKLLPSISGTVLMKILGLKTVPEVAMIKLEHLQKKRPGSNCDPVHFLSRPELEKHDLFKYEKRRTEWLGGRVAAKKAVLDHLEIPVTVETMVKWPVFADETGRPFFKSAQHPEISLSISHSNGIASAMVATSPSCGLDIQKITNATIRVKEKFCKEAEETVLSTSLAPQHKKATNLTLLWAAKEALRKALSGRPLTGFLAMKLDKIGLLDENCWTFNLMVKDKSHRIVVFIYQDHAVAMCTAEPTSE